MKVPEVLLSGDHERIKQWRREVSSELLTGVPICFQSDSDSGREATQVELSAHLCRAAPSPGLR
jgi:hypothetical protein